MPTARLKLLKQKGSPRGEAGIVPPILLFVAAVGLITFFVITSLTPFKDELMNKLYPKPPSHATESIDSHFATAGKVSSSLGSFYSYNWNPIAEHILLNNAFPIDQLAPAPNHDFAWMAAKTNYYTGDSGGGKYGNGNTKDSVDKIFEKEQPVITQILSKDINKGGVWIIGNEVTWRPLGIYGEGPDESPEIYAYQFYKYWQLIKGVDPTAKIANAGFLFYGERSNTGLLEYLDAVLSSPEMHGVKPDIYNYHSYGWGYNETAYDQYLGLARNFKNHVHSIPGEENKPIWLTEFAGKTNPGWDGDTIANEKAFMDYVIPKLIEQNLVDKFFWFIGPECCNWFGLTNTSGQPTELGEHYKALAISNSTITPSISDDKDLDKTASFNLQANPTTANLDNQVTVTLNAQSNEFAANLFSAKLNFPVDKLEVLKIDYTGSFVTQWTEQKFDNAQGTISLIGGVINPGYQTNGKDSLMATITFKTKQVGTATIDIDQASQIFKNSDNRQILAPDSKGVTVTITAPLPAPTVAPKPTAAPTTKPTAAPTAKPSAVPTQPPAVKCSITSTSWKVTTNSAIEGTLVNMDITGVGDCNGKTVNLEIRKDNGLTGSSAVKNKPQSAVFSGTTAVSTWLSEYTPNGPFGFFDPPQYFFNTTLNGSTTIVKSTAPNLGVYKAKTLKKGDGTRDGKIGLEDLSALLTHWSKKTDFPREVDMNDDGVLNAFDYSSIIEVLKQNNTLSR